jgi:hypothetical protein
MAKSISEAASEVLQKSIANAGHENFGAGKKLGTTPGQKISDLGTAGHKATDSNYDAAKDAPRAVPPGQSPPVGSEPMKKLSGEPQQTAGRKDLAGSPEGGETPEQDKVNRKKGPLPKKTFQANKGAKDPVVPESEEDDEDWEPESEPEDDYEDELEEATMEEVQKDLQELSDEEFQKKYGASKKQVIAKIKELQAQQQTQRNESDEIEEDELVEKEHDDLKVPVKFNNYKQKPIKDQVKNIDSNMKKKVPATDKACCKEDIDAILAGEDLSEEFKEKATVIFEAAVNARVEAIQEEIEKQYVEEFEVALESVKEDFADKLDSYLDYVVENWMEENKLAIEKGLRTEIAEDFMEALRNVFVEHYIDIPEDKADLVDGLVEKVEELEESLNSEMSRNVELKKKISEHKQSEIIHSVTEGLTLSQSEKIKALANGVEYISEDDYESKLITIRENYFPSLIKTPPTDSLNDPVELDEEVSTKVVDSVIEKYASLITKQTKF